MDYEIYIRGKYLGKIHATIGRLERNHVEIIYQLLEEGTEQVKNALDLRNYLKNKGIQITEKGLEELTEVKELSERVLGL